VAEQTVFLATERSQECYLEKSRGWCFLDDLAVEGNIGPLFLDGYISLIETSDCLQVTSLALNTSLSSEGAHGVQGDRPRYIMNQMDQGSAEWTLLPSKR